MSSARHSAADPRTVRTQQLLVQAFNALLHEKGFPAMTVQEIAARATVNRATFYAHFDDKYALFAHATRVGFIELVRQRVNVDGPYTEEQLRRLVGALCEFLAQLNQRCVTSFRAFEPMIATEVVAGIELTLSRWVAAGQALESPRLAPAELTSHVASWGMYGVVRSWILNQCPEPAEQFTERVVPLVAPIIRQALAA
jgi:AcrR family transcriptional regulator